MPNKQLEIKFKIHRVVTVDKTTEGAIKLLLDIATREYPIYHYPKDWWQMFKEQYFPKWLKRKSPVKYNEVLAVHSYPDINVPNLGSEFVTVKVMDYDTFEKECKKHGQDTREVPEMREVRTSGGDII